VLAVLCLVDLSVRSSTADYSGMDQETALFILCRIVHHFITVITEEAKTLPPDSDGKFDLWL